MIEWLILGVVIGLCLAVACGGRRGGLEGDIIKDRPRPGEGHSPNVPPADWSRPPPPSGSAIQRGPIPGRPGQEIDSGGDSIIPPLRPDPPRAVERRGGR